MTMSLIFEISLSRLSNLDSMVFEKEQMYDSETLAIDTVLNKEHFCGKIMQKMSTKGSFSPRPLFYFGKQTKLAIACKKFL